MKYEYLLTKDGKRYAFGIDAICAYLGICRKTFNNWKRSGRFEHCYKRFKGSYKFDLDMIDRKFKGATPLDLTLIMWDEKKKCWLGETEENEKQLKKILV